MPAQSNTEEIKAKLDIVDIIKEYIELKPAGVNHKARCPFHNEKTPSFIVGRERQMYHCFGCSEHGDIFSFVMKMEGIEFPEALRLLAKRAGVEIHTEDPRTRNERTKQFDILKFAALYYQENLRRLPDTHPVKQYVAERQLRPETLDLFQIGFAPDSWDAMTDALAKKNVHHTDALSSGLVMKKDTAGKLYDRFRCRLMFPICDAHGSVIGFGGRTIPNLRSETGGPEAAKYINTPQTSLYNKSAVLYGLHLAKGAIRKEKRVVVVEGYMDCISSQQSGSENVVAASGTAFTQDQAKLIKRFTDTVVLAFDMDEAGIAAAGRGVDVLLAEGLTVRVAVLPSGKDPDELIRKDVAAWKHALAHPQLYMDFAFDQVTKNKDANDVEDKKQMARILLPIISRMANGVEQTHYLQKLSAIVHAEEQVLRDMIRKSPDASRRNASLRSLSISGKKLIPQEEAAQELLSIILKSPDFFAIAEQTLSDSAIPKGPYRELYILLKFQYTQKHEIDLGEFQRQLAAEQPDLAHYLDVCELGASRLPDTTEHMGKQLISLLMQEYLKIQLARLSMDMAEAEKMDDRKQIASLTQTFERITHDLKKFTS